MRFWGFFKVAPKNNGQGPVIPIFAPALSELNHDGEECDDEASRQSGIDWALGLYSVTFCTIPTLFLNRYSVSLTIDLY